MASTGLKDSFKFSAGQFIVRPAEADALENHPNSVFNRSVLHILKHNERGTMGIDITKPMNDDDARAVLQVIERAGKVKFEAFDLKNRIYHGGPIISPALVIADPFGIEGYGRRSSQGSLIAAITAENIANIMNQTSRAALFNGAAIWHPQQLSQEIAHMEWAVIGDDTPDSNKQGENFLFDIPPEQRWVEAAKIAGLQIPKAP